MLFKGTVGKGMDLSSKRKVIFHFEMYRVEVLLNGQSIGYLERFSNSEILLGNGKWFFTKHGASRFMNGYINSKRFDKAESLKIERVIRSNRVRERLSKKAKA